MAIMITIKVNGVILIITLSIITTGVRTNQTLMETILQYILVGKEDGTMITFIIPIILFAINHLLVSYFYPVIIFLKKIKDQQFHRHHHLKAVSFLYFKDLSRMRLVFCFGFNFTVSVKPSSQLFIQIVMLIGIFKGLVKIRTVSNTLVN